MSIYFNKTFLRAIWRTLVVCCALLLFSKEKLQAQTLAAGDIAFIGYDFGTIDGFSFIALKPLPAGETIYFSEQGWTADGWANNTETHLRWVIPSTVPCGTIITVMETSADAFTVSGTSGFSIALNSNFNLLGGDQILAYQSTSGVRPASPIFIAGVHGDYNSTNYNTSTIWNDNNLSGTAESILPTGLTNGVNCISLFPAPGPEQAYSKYNGTLTGTAAALRAAINDTANWAKSGTASLGLLPANFPTPSVNCTVIVNPTVTTTAATNVGAVRATLGGNVTADGGASVTERGIVWALGANPTTSDNKVVIASGTGTFSSVISSLPSATTIHFRAYAINSSGTAYGSDLTFTTNAALSATTSFTNVSCNGGSNGTATVIASGGVTPYTYSWSPSGGTAATATGLAAFAYTCTITDNEGTSITRNFNITQPSSSLNATTSQTNVSCNGGTNGTATVNVSGGTPGYTYSWAQSGGTAATASGLAVGTYTVTITDANTCQITRTVTVTEPTFLDFPTYSGQTIVSVGATVAYSFVATGGNSGYTFSRTGNLPIGLTLSNSGELSGTATTAGDYTFNVTVTDSKGCIRMRTVNIKVVDPLPVTLTNFSAKTVSNGVEVFWTTVSENNSSHFELRHATNEGQFKPIANIEAQGNSSTGKRYSYLHRNAINGNNYYQLLQVDKNSDTHDYGVKEARFGTNVKETVSIFPNPATRTLTVGFPAGNYTKLQVVDAVGKILSTKKIATKDYEIKLEINNLPVGLYTIRLSSGNHQTTHKFIKQ